jgi:dTDP-4-dehydrorhamnose 3,5-epimerase
MTGAWTLHPLKQFPDERGTVLHMLRANEPHYEVFGEIYFSTILRGKVKAWHMHRRKTVNLAVPIGRVRIVIFPDGGTPEEMTLGRSSYQLLTIRPGCWYGFQGLAEEESLIANCATEPFDAAEGVTRPFDSADIPYVWPDLLGGALQ